jgi:hypothetical protein
MGDNIYLDDNLNCSDEPTATRPDSGAEEDNPDVEVTMPDVEITGATPDMLKESDSVSTFRSKKVQQNRADVHTKKSSVSFAQSTTTASNFTSETTPSSYNNVQEDGSVSKLSDTASRLSMFEDRFNVITDELCGAIEDVKLQNVKQQRDFQAQQELLHSILAILQNHPQAQQLTPDDPSTPSPPFIADGTDNGQLSVASVQANHLPQLNQAGDPNRAAGNDY